MFWRSYEKCKKGMDGLFLIRKKLEFSEVHRQLWTTILQNIGLILRCLESLATEYTFDEGMQDFTLKSAQSSPVMLFEQCNCFEWDSHPQKGRRCFGFFQQVLRKSISNSGILISADIKALKIIFQCFLEPKSTQVLTPRQNSIYTLWFLDF